MTEAGSSTLSKAAAAAAAASEYPGKLVSAASIASPFQNDITQAIAKRKAQGRNLPKLIGILATPSPPSVAYAEWTKKACEQVGIQFEIWKTWQDEKDNSNQQEKINYMQGVEEEKPDTDLEADVEDLIIAANADDDVHGIMVYYPIFGGRQDTYLQQILDPRKDVEGLHFSYCWNMYHNVRWVLPKQVGGAPGTTTEVTAGLLTDKEVIPPGFAKSILPCTPLAIVKCLESMGVYDKTLPYGDRLYGKVITVINRSEVVGRPLAALLSNDGAKVYSIDLGSIQEFNKRISIENDRRPSVSVMKAREKNSQRRLKTHHTVRPCNMTMEQCIKSSDVVISGVPSDKFKINTEWIKKGAVTVNFSSEKNFEKDVRRNACKHLPAIGKMTIAMLQRNLLRLVEYRELSAGSTGHGSDSRGPHGPFGKGLNGHNGAGGPSKPSSGSSYSRTGSGGGSSFRPIGESSGGAQDNDANKYYFQTESNYTSSPYMKLNQNGPSSRGRASTITFPQSDRIKKRLPSFSQISPTIPLLQGRSGSVSATSNLWDWRQANRRESIASGMIVPLGACSPPPCEVTRNQITPLNQPSPLFAPISPFQSNQIMTPMSQGTIHTARPVSFRSNSAYTASSPRSGTPISPLFIDGLSAEEGTVISSGVPESRSSWDYNSPQTPREGQIVPSVFERPTKDLPQRHPRTYFSPKDDKMIFSTSSGIVSPPDNLITSFIQQPTPDRVAHSRRRRRPPFSYSSLIAQAISSSSEGRMTLREIYTWISSTYPDLYSMEGSEGSGWQNTARHNLSLNKSFVKLPRTAQDIYESCSSGVASLSQAARGKGGWWTLDHTVAQAQFGMSFKGENEMMEFADEYNYDQSSNQGQRAQRRRRTSSSAHSVLSSDEPQSPGPDQYLPSVLQPPHLTRGRSRETIIQGPIPTVFLSARTRSAERAQFKVEMNQQAGRTRGFTTGDASLAFQSENSPSSSQSASMYGPSKRKIPSHPYYQDRFEDVVSPYPQTLLGQNRGMAPFAHPSHSQTQFNQQQQHPFHSISASSSSTSSSNKSHTPTADSTSPPSRISAIGRANGLQRAVGVLSISDLLNT